MSFAQNLAKTLGSLPYSTSLKNELAARRARLSEGLAIDRLLSSAGVSKPAEVYPCSSREAVQELVGAIDQSSSSRIFQSRAVYYLFLDFSEAGATGDAGVTIAQYYAAQMWMSASEQQLVQGLWLLDRGRPDDALAPLGHDWEARGDDRLHAYIVAALADQRPAAVAAYLAARGVPGTHTAELVRSLALRGKFYEVLEIAREYREADFLRDIARAAVHSKATALEMAQLCCTPEEWLVIADELAEMVSSPPPGTDAQATADLVRNVRLVRALHLGDNETLSELRGTGNADLYIRNAQLTTGK